MNQRKGLSTKWVVLGVVVLLGLWLVSSYNSLVSAEQGVETEWSQVETEYQRRVDLIPNLVSVAQGAADFEQSTLTAVTEARTQWLNTASNANATTEEEIAAARNLDGALSRLLVSVEAYPTLTATETFKTLQVQLEGTENRVTVARQDYNDAAGAYDIMVKRFPGRLTAMLFGFEEKPLFESSEGAENAPDVEFDF